MEHDRLIREIQILAKELRLSVIRSNCEKLAQKAAEDDLTFLEFLLYILQQEMENRKAKRTVTRIKQAGLVKAVKPDSFELPDGYGLDKRKLKIIFELLWLKRLANILLIGANGTGKTTLAKIILSLVVAEGMKGFYVRFVELADILANKDKDPAARKKYDYIVHQINLLVIDDVYPCQLSLEVSLAFSVMVDILHEKASIIITSRRPVNEWKEVFFSDSITKTILERLIFNSETIALKAPSFRIAKHTGFFDLYDEEGNEIESTTT